MQKSLQAQADLVVLTYACTLPATTSAPGFLIEVTAHFAQRDGTWQRIGLRALDTFSPSPMSGFPTWQEYQTLSPARIALDMGPTLAALWPDMPRETAAHNLYAILGLKFSDSPRLQNWIDARRSAFDAFKTALLQRRAENNGRGFALTLRNDKDTPLGHAMLRLGLQTCIVTRAGTLDPVVMEPDTPEIDCSYAHVGGDNRAGFLWSSTPERIPRLRLNRVYFLLDLGGGWFAYRET
ncbi:hypothetical protein N4R57_14830 [Rhodobacteraceae bacterium D3-12]|nr:hypothetical protein N4R57_14830 [Rhodobacteraceae bacterium D3-12]